MNKGSVDEDSKERANIARDFKYQDKSITEET